MPNNYFDTLGQLTEAEYKELRYHIILQSEESGIPKLTPYSDSEGIMSMGVGLNLQGEANVRAILEVGFNIDLDKTNNANIDTLIRDILIESRADFLLRNTSGQLVDANGKIITNGKGVVDAASLSQASIAIKKLVNDAKVVDLNGVIVDLKTSGFKIVNGVDKAEEKVREIFEQQVPIYENNLSTYLQTSVSGGAIAYDDGNANSINGVALNMDYSYERLALLSLEYNDNPSLAESKQLLGNDSNIHKALQKGDHFRVWYEIRYVSNIKKISGVASRRMLEAQPFAPNRENLFVDPSAPTAAEVQLLVDSITGDFYQGKGKGSNIEAMIAYEDPASGDKLGRAVDIARSNLAAINGRLQLAGQSTFDVTISTLGEIFKPFQEELLDFYTAGLDLSAQQIDGDVALGVTDFGTEGDTLQPFYRPIWTFSPKPGDGLTDTNGHTISGINDLLIGVLEKSYTAQGLYGDDIIVGNSEADIIYGGYLDEQTNSSRDQTAGGDDTLVGNAGDDTLFGQYGDDTLYGGDNKDKLEGGKGNDVLKGGQGDDVYTFNYGDGRDVVVDSSGANTLLISHSEGAAVEDIRTVGLLTEIAEGTGIYRQLDSEGDLLNATTYYLVKDSDGGPGIYELQISVNSFKGGSILVKNFDKNNNTFGLTFIAAEAPEIPTNGDTIAVNDFDSLADVSSSYQSRFHDIAGRPDYSDSSFSYDGTQFSFVSSTGDVSQVIQSFQGGVHGDNLYGRNAFITGLPSLGSFEVGQRLDGHAGDDYIFDGVGSSLLQGGVGNDYIVGGLDSDTIRGGVLFGYDQVGDPIYYDLHDNQPSEFIDGDRNVAVVDQTGLLAVEDNDIIFDDITLSAENAAIDRSDRYSQARTNYLRAASIYSRIDAGVGDDYVQVTGVAFGEDPEVSQPGNIRDLTQGYSISNYRAALGAGSDVYRAEGNFDVYVGGDASLGDADVGPGEEHGGLISTQFVFHFSAEFYASSNNDDFIFSGGGDDILLGEYGNDYIDGGDGNDAIHGDAVALNQQYYEYFSFSNSPLSTAIPAADISLEDQGNDYLNGGAGSDYIDGGGGDDIIYGGADGDLIIGDGYNDAAEGKDRLYGDGGDDEIFAGSGDDEIEGGDGDDQLRGEAGADFIKGDDDADTLWGGGGSDILRGGDGDDTLYGGSESDNLLGGVGTDTLEGQDGDDYLRSGAGENSLIGGAGTDYYIVEANSGSTYINDFDLTSSAGILKLPFGVRAEDVTVTANGIDLVLKLGAAGGDITIYNHFLSADYPLASIDFFDGSTWDADYVSDLARQPTPGDDQIPGTNIGEVLSGGDGNDVIVAQAGNDEVSGDAGNDTLYGDEGDDVLLGGVGDDILDGGNGLDSLTGGAGNDLYVYRFVYGSQGGYTVIDNFDADVGRIDRLRIVGLRPSVVDVAVARVGDDLSVFPVFPNEAETLEYGVTIKNYFLGSEYRVNFFEFDNNETWDFADVQSRLLDGTAFDDSIHGYIVSDSIHGKQGADSLFGHEGDDTLYGDEGDDYIHGGSGSDVLTGGVGTDTVIGDDGNDVYRYSLEDGDLLIDNYSNSNDFDTLQFDESISLEDLNLTRLRFGYDLTITIVSTGDVITVQDYFKGDDYKLDQIDFNGVQQLDSAAIVAATATIFEGTSNSGTIVGTSGKDIIDGKGGSDTLFGRGGNDILLDNEGYNTLYGEEGDDVLYSGGQQGRLYGGEGNDSLHAGGGYSRLYGGEGDDSYFVNIENSGNVRIDTEASVPGSGDTLYFGAGILSEELVFKRDGDDLNILVEVTGVVVNIDDYFDTTVNQLGTISFNDSVTWNESDIQAAVLADANIATALDDVLTGSNGVADVINGLGGSDTLFGLGGDDTLISGEGYDGDYLHGGDDNDLLIAQSAYSTLVGGKGSDTYEITQSVFDAGSGYFEIRSDGVASDSLVLTADVAPDEFEVTRYFNDLELYHEGTDTYGTVNDFFNSEVNSLHTISFTDSTTWTVDYLLDIVNTATENNDFLVGADLSDDIITGLQGDDQLYGRGGNDTLLGNEEDDYLYGGDDNDTLSGDAGNDDLFGGDGNDTLIGGTGDDEYDGGAGDDIFVYRLGDGDVFINQQVDGGEGGIGDGFGGEGEVAEGEVAEGEVAEGEVAEGEVAEGEVAAVGNDVLRLVDLNPADVSLQRGEERWWGFNNDILLVTIISTGAVIKVQDYFAGVDLELSAIEFQDGTSWDFSTVNLLINRGGVNASPVAADDVGSIAEDTVVEIDVADLLVNDSDADGDSLFVTGVTNSINGTAELNEQAGTITFTPNLNYNGPASFDYIASDGISTDVATVNLTVTAQNDAPVARDDIAVGTEGTALVLNVVDLIANDSDVEGGDLFFTGVVNSVNGLAVYDSETQAVTFTPDANYDGPASFDYTLSDGTLTDTATVNLTINRLNEAPIAVDDFVAATEDVGIVITFADLLGNDSDSDGDSLSIISVSNSVNGFAILDTQAGTVTFSSPDDYNGAASFDYTLSDGTATSTATVNLTVTPENDAPIAINDVDVTGEDINVVINVADLLSNDSDVDGDNLSISAVLNGVNGLAVLDTLAGTITFSPTADYNGPASFDYTLSDGTTTSTATVNLSVTAENDAPTAINDTASTNEGDDVVFTFAELLSNDSDIEGDSLSITAVTNSVNGAVIFDSQAGTITFTPSESYNGPASFDYTVSDGSAVSTATVSIDVVRTNDAPVAVSDTVEVIEDTAAIISVNELLANDTDFEGDNLTVTAVSSPVNGSVVLDALAGTITFTPDENYFGAANFNYTISDGADSATSSVEVLVTGVNDAPDGVDDGATTVEDTSVQLNIADLLANDSDLDSDILTITSVESAGNGDVVLDQQGGIITYTPDENYNGADSFVYTVSDGTDADTATVFLTVTAENDAPIAVDDLVTTNEDNRVHISFSSLMENDSDADIGAGGDSIQVSSVSNAINGTVVRGFGISFTPDDDFFGTASFDYSITDGDEISTATVTVIVEAVNDAPIAIDDVVTTNEDTAVVINIADLIGNDSDIDGDSLTITTVANSVNGSALLDGQTGTITFTPNLNYNGPASFDYTLSDGVVTDTATVNLSVNLLNDAPVAGDDVVTTNEDTLVVIDVADLLSNDSDVDGDSLVITAVTNGVNGAAILDSQAGTISFTPNANYSGPASFDYTISDGDITDTATVNLTINPENDAPIAADDVADTDAGTTVVINVADLLSNDSDIDGDSLSITSVLNGLNGTAILDSQAGTILFTPDVDYSGPASFDYTVSDGDALGTATVNVTVRPENRAPVATADVLTVSEDRAVAVDAAVLLSNDNDIDGDSITVTAVSNAVNGLVFFSAPVGAVLFIPSLNYNGPASFDYTISDGHFTDTATVNITVQAVNDAPIATDDVVATGEGKAVLINIADLLSNDVDVDGDSLSITSVLNTANGTAIFDSQAGTILFTPDTDYNGVASFEYTVSDGNVFDTASVNITVTPENDAPVASNDVVVATEDTAVVINVADLLVNDSDIDADSLTIIAADNGVNGSVVFDDQAGTITFTPDGDYNGPASFDYTISDRTTTDTATVTVNVGAVNDAPIANGDVVAATEDTAVVISVADLLANDSDIDADTLTITAVDNGINGSVVFDDQAGAVTFTPDTDYNGPASFDYTVNDGTTTDTATVSINIGATNDAPIASDDVVAATEDTAIVINVADLLSNDSDIDADSLTITTLSNGANGSVVFDDQAGTITFTPDANYNGAASFDYTVSDGTTTDSATVNLTIESVNDAPVANTDTSAADEDTSVVITLAELLANDSDVDGDALTVASVSNATNGSVVIDLDAGVVTFTPDANYEGAASFDYELSDGQATAVGTVNLSIAALNDAPLLSGDDLVAIEDTVLVINVADLLANDSDIDGDNLAITSVANAVNGSVVFDAVAGTITFSPNANYSGPASFEYTASDGAISATADVNISVSSVNDAPTANDDNESVTQDNTVVITVADLLANDIDLEGDSLVITEVANAANGLVVLDAAAGTIAFTPDANYSGPASFDYTVSDGELLSTATVVIDVIAVIQGGGGSDVITGGSGDDIIDGQDGNDRLEGGAGDDLVEGGDGSDRVYGNLGNDTVAGGEGTDRVYGNEGNDLVSGGEGNDRVYGNEGNDVVSGGDGTDRVYGNDGNDNVSGGAGNDRVYGDAGEDIVSGGEGDDRLYGGAGNDVATGGVGADRVRGNDGDDTVSGGEGSDRVYGDAGNDVASGGLGDDRVTGGAGDDVVSGDQGDDRVYGDQGNDTVSGGAGDDRVGGGEGDDLITGGQGIDRVYGDNGNDIVSGGEGEDRVYGGDGNDQLSGGADADRVYGGAGNDIVNGDEGADRIYGGDGDDSLRGGLGDDYLRGDAGSDSYLFADGFGRDTLINSNAAAEDIDIAVFENAATEDLWFSRSGNTLQINIVGTEDQLSVRNWYRNGDNQLDEIIAGDSVLLNNQVDQLVAAMSAYSVPTGVGSVITQEVKDTLAPVLTSVWQNV